MADGFEIADPSDWHNTRLAGLATIDSGLRCQICKDFYNSAVITSCEHTFCSLCIRRSLAADGHCPTCRTVEQETRLRKNVAVQELTDAFVAARPDVLKIATEPTDAEEAPSRRGSKRKRGEPVSEERPSEARQTRSQKRRAVESSSQADELDGARDDDAADGDYTPEVVTIDESPAPDDDLVPCPICHKRMKPESVFSHLDTCEQEMAASSSRARSKSNTPLQGQHSHTPKVPPAERLPQLNYSLLNDQALRKKLSQLGIPTWGSKQLLTRRHTEWINLWNANCDSARPRSKKELLAELDLWERSQGGRALNNAHGNAVMNKDFDGAGWARKNKGDFDDLIANARRMRARAAPATAPESEATAPAPAPNTASWQEGLDSVNAATHGAEWAKKDKSDLDDLIARAKIAMGPLNPALLREAAAAASAPDTAAGRADSESVTAAAHGPEGKPRHGSAANGGWTPKLHAQPSHDPPANPATSMQRRPPAQPTSLPDHISETFASARTMPMFELPQEPVNDAETTR